jgi:hypothetical protein
VGILKGLLRETLYNSSLECVDQTNQLKANTESATGSSTEKTLMFLSKRRSGDSWINSKTTCMASSYKNAFCVHTVTAITSYWASSIYLPSSQPISLRSFLIINKPSGNRTRSFNTAKTKVHHWTRFWTKFHLPPILTTYIPKIHLLINKLSGNRTRNFNTAKTKAHHWTRFWASSIHVPSSQPISLRSIY